MVRSNQPLVERMTLIWHDWFATSDDGVGIQRQMLDQNETVPQPRARRRSTTSLRAVTVDPAMLMWLDGVRNRKGRDQRELRARADGAVHARRGPRRLHGDGRARAREGAVGLAGRHLERRAARNFRFDPARFDSSTKTLFAEVPGYGPKVGNFGWEDAVRLCIEHPLHPSFAVSKLWSYFIPTPPPEDERRHPRAALRADRLPESGRSWRRSCSTRTSTSGPRMVKPPVVLCAGLLRAMGRSVDREWWSLTRDRRAVPLPSARRLRVGRHPLARHPDGPRPLEPRR